MKWIGLLALLTLSSQSWALDSIKFDISKKKDARFLVTQCLHEDCFKYGWTTKEPKSDYELQCQCKNQDCVNEGWESEDTEGSIYKVTCKVGGCFTEGWKSIQWDRGYILVDEVVCKKNNCLKNGWTVRSSYGLSGEVLCKQGDCSRYGGLSLWRGLKSETTCLHKDCYRWGWTAQIGLEP